MAVAPTRSIVWEGSTAVLLARYTDAAGDLVLQSIFDSIKITFRDSTDFSTEVTGETLTISSVIFDTLQDTVTGGIWTVDLVGYNFKHRITGTDIPNGDTTYRAILQFIETGGARWYDEFEITTESQPFD